MPGAQELFVLLVEDNEQDVALLRRSFQRLDNQRCTLDWAPSLEVAKEKIANQHHDVALIDLQLTDSWGLDTLDKLKDLAPHLPLVVLTGASPDRLALPALRGGAQDYISKDDLSPQLLLRTVLYALERHRLVSMVTRSERMASVGQLSAGVAHELNSPLAQIEAELTEIGQGLGVQPAHETLGPCLNRALVRVREIKETVEALYSFSSSQGGRKALFDATKTVQFARRLAEDRLRHAAQVEERVEQLAHIEGDQGRFTQAVLDLLNHASDVARHSRTGVGRVWLDAFLDGGEVVVVVEDDGPTVPSAHREKLLEPFGATRAISSARGSGLGLAAAREVAREHGGELQVLDGRYGGARFELRVPQAKAPEDAKGTSSSRSRNGNCRAKILWIDDDVHLLRAFQRRLSRDHDVDVCASATEALARIDRGERWDVICCDLMMPETTGREFEAILSARHPSLAARLIFVTGGVFSEEERRFLERSQQPKLLKPFDWDAFLNVVEEIRA